MERNQKSKIDGLHNCTKEELKSIGVYTIISKQNGTTYVGSTSKEDGASVGHIGFKQRWEDHASSLLRNKHHNKHLQAHVNKYGIENLQFDVLEISEPRFIESLELFWINQLDTVRNGFNQCYLTNKRFGKSHPRYKDLIRYHKIITTLYKLGVGSKWIANHFKVSDRKIIDILHSESVKIDRRRNFVDTNTIYSYYLNSHLTVEQTANYFEMETSTVCRLFKENKLPRKMEIVRNDINTIFKRYCSGETVNNLANEYKVDYISINKEFKKQNLKYEKAQ